MKLSCNRRSTIQASWYISAFCLVLLPMIGCSSESDSAGGDKQSKKIQTVTVAGAVEEEVTEYVELVGRMSANELVDIRSRVSGFLLKRHFTDGQRVKAGEMLFTIEPDQYEAVYQQSLAQIEVAKAQLGLAQKTFARSANLLEKNAVSRQEYEQNQAQVATAEAQLVAAKADAEKTKLDVNYTKITSPIDGRVDRRLIDEGNYVTGGMLGGTVLTTVINDHPIKAIANVDENTTLAFRRRLREIAGDDYQEEHKVADLNVPCFLQLSDEKDFPHKGKVEYAEIRVDQNTGTSQMRAVFDNETGLLRVGMFVRMRVPVTDPYKAVLVPDRAIGTDQATRFVYVVDDKNKIQQRQVEIGDRKGEQRIVKSGVKPGENVVVAGLQLVQPGMEVKTEQQKDKDKEKDKEQGKKASEGDSSQPSSETQQPSKDGQQGQSSGEAKT